MLSDLWRFFTPDPIPPLLSAVHASHRRRFCGKRFSDGPPRHETRVLPILNPFRGRESFANAKWFMRARRLKGGTSVPAAAYIINKCVRTHTQAHIYVCVYVYSWHSTTCHGLRREPEESFHFLRKKSTKCEKKSGALSSLRFSVETRKTFILFCFRFYFIFIYTNVLQFIRYYLSTYVAIATT